MDQRDFKCLETTSWYGWARLNLSMLLFVRWVSGSCACLALASPLVALAMGTFEWTSLRPLPMTVLVLGFVFSTTRVYQQFSDLYVMENRLVLRRITSGEVIEMELTDARWVSGRFGVFSSGVCDADGTIIGIVFCTGKVLKGAGVRPLEV